MPLALDVVALEDEFLEDFLDFAALSAEHMEHTGVFEEEGTALPSGTVATEVALLLPAAPPAAATATSAENAVGGLPAPLPVTTPTPPDFAAPADVADVAMPQIEDFVLSGRRRGIEDAVWRESLAELAELTVPQLRDVLYLEGLWHPRWARARRTELVAQLQELRCQPGSHFRATGRARAAEEAARCGGSNSAVATSAASVPGAPCGGAPLASSAACRSSLGGAGHQASQGPGSSSAQRPAAVGAIDSGGSEIHYLMSRQGTRRCAMQPVGDPPGTLTLLDEGQRRQYLAGLRDGMPAEPSAAAESLAAYDHVPASVAPAESVFDVPAGSSAANDHEPVSDAPMEPVFCNDDDVYDNVSADSMP